MSKIDKLVKALKEFQEELAKQGALRTAPSTVAGNATAMGSGVAQQRPSAMLAAQAMTPQMSGQASPKFSGVAQRPAAGAGQAYLNTMGNVGRGIGRAAGTMVGAAVNPIGTAARALSSPAAQNIGGAVRSGVEGVRNAEIAGLKGVGNSIASGARGVSNAVGSGWRGVGGAVRDAFKCEYPINKTESLAMSEHGQWSIKDKDVAKTNGFDATKPATSNPGAFGAFGASKPTPAPIPNTTKAEAGPDPTVMIANKLMKPESEVGENFAVMGDKAQFAAGKKHPLQSEQKSKKKSTK